MVIKQVIYVIKTQYGQENHKKQHLLGMGMEKRVKRMTMYKVKYIMQMIKQLTIQKKTNYTLKMTTKELEKNLLDF